MEINLKKIFLLLLFTSLSLFAKYTSEYPTQKLINSGIPIVDIRTAPEWHETGVLKNAVPITFFRPDGSYDVKDFLAQLNAKVDTKKPFALICHTGHRTSIVAPWLAKDLHYNVINLEGGMDYVTKGLHIKTIPYKAKD